jgi:hypothetical protein
LRFAKSGAFSKLNYFKNFQFNTPFLGVKNSWFQFENFCGEVFQRSGIEHQPHSWFHPGVR